MRVRPADAGNDPPELWLTMPAGVRSVGDPYSDVSPESFPIPSAQIARAGRMWREGLFRGSEGVNLAPVVGVVLFHQAKDVMIFPGLFVGRPDQLINSLAKAFPRSQGDEGQIRHSYFLF